MKDFLKFFESMSPETYLTAVIGSIFLSLALRVAGKKDAANFVGLWAPTICNLGLYLKLLQPGKKGIFR